jgi:hypothetical protein
VTKNSNLSLGLFGKKSKVVEKKLYEDQIKLITTEPRQKQMKYFINP